jgi:hypothetical protein
VYDIVVWMSQRWTGKENLLEWQSNLKKNVGECTKIGSVIKLHGLHEGLKEEEICNPTIHAIIRVCTTTRNPSDTSCDNGKRANNSRALPLFARWLCDYRRLTDRSEENNNGLQLATQHFE